MKLPTEHFNRNLQKKKRPREKTSKIKTPTNSYTKTPPTKPPIKTDIEN